MSRAALSLLAFVLVWSALRIFASLAVAQHYLLEDGTRLDAASVTVRGRELVQVLATAPDEGTAERVFAIERVRALDWPTPAELVRAREQLGRGEYLAAAIEPVLARFAPFAALPGSWWGEAVGVRGRALLGLGEDEAAAAAVQPLLAAPHAPELQAEARLLLAEIDLRAGQDQLAATRLDELATHASLSAAAQARLEVLRGELALFRGDAEAALEAFLQVPVFFSREAGLMPAALAGAVRAYQRLGDAEGADRTRRDLQDSCPESAAAAADGARAGAPETP